MGNALAKKFDIGKDYGATAGHLGSWKIWHGRKKGGTPDDDEISIWTFSREDLAKLKRNPVTDKTIQEQIAQLMRKDLLALKDCTIDGIIEVTEVVEDSSVDAGFFDNGRSVSEMEISRGLLNLVEGLQYLHTVQRKLHLNIAPESVVITANGVWKLCSLGLCLSFQQGEALRLPSPYFLKSDANDKERIRLEPDLRYYGPEMTEGGFNPVEIRYLTPSTDVFSLGILFYEIYRFNLLSTSVHSPIIGVVSNAVNFHRAALDALSVLDYSFLSMNIQFLIRGMMQTNVSARLTTQSVANAQIFTSGVLSVLKTVDTLPARDLGTQCSQLIALPNHLASFPTRVLAGTILPVVCRLCVANPQVWIHALHVHVSIARLIPLDRYRIVAGKSIANGLNVTSSTDVMMAFLQAVEWILLTFDRSFCERHVITLFSNAMDISNITVQTMALTMLSEEDVLKHVGMHALVEKLVPKACKEACKNSDANVKIHALFFLSLVCARLDREYVIRNILPSFKYILEHEKNPIVSMCIIGNYEKIADVVGPEYIASSILPMIQPLLVDRSLNKQQFALVVNLTRSLLQRVVGMRTDEMGMPSVDWTILPTNQGLDPFQAARNLVAASKKTLTPISTSGASTGNGTSSHMSVGSSVNSSSSGMGIGMGSSSSIGQTNNNNDDDGFFGNVSNGHGRLSTTTAIASVNQHTSTGTSTSGKANSSSGHGSSYGSASGGSGSSSSGSGSYGVGGGGGGGGGGGVNTNDKASRIVGMGSEGVAHKGSGSLLTTPVATISDAAKDGLKVLQSSTLVNSIASSTAVATAGNIAGNIAGWFNKNQPGNGSNNTNNNNGIGSGSGSANTNSSPNLSLGSSGSSNPNLSLGSGIGSGISQSSGSGTSNFSSSNINSIGSSNGMGISGSSGIGNNFGNNSSSSTGASSGSGSGGVGGSSSSGKALDSHDFLSSFGDSSNNTHSTSANNNNNNNNSSTITTSSNKKTGTTSSLRKVGGHTTGGGGGAIPMIRPPPAISPSSSINDLILPATITNNNYNNINNSNNSSNNMDMFAGLQSSANVLQPQQQQQQQQQQPTMQGLSYNMQTSMSMSGSSSSSSSPSSLSSSFPSTMPLSSSSSMALGQGLGPGSGPGSMNNGYMIQPQANTLSMGGYQQGNTGQGGMYMAQAQVGQPSSQPNIMNQPQYQQQSSQQYQPQQIYQQQPSQFQSQQPYQQPANMMGMMNINIIGNMGGMGVGAVPSLVPQPINTFSQPTHSQGTIPNQTNKEDPFAFLD